MSSLFFRKLLSAYLSLALLWQSFVPAVVLASELEASPSAQTELTEPSSAPEPLPTPSPEPEPSPEPVVLPNVEATQSADPVQSATPVLTWLQIDDKTDVTVDPVVVGKTYQFRNTKVSLTFSRVDQPGFLTIKEINLNDEQVEELSALSNTAYEITSTMPDGSFAYDLTLPLPQTSVPVVAKLAENVDELDSDSQSVGLVEQTSDTVTLSNLDHFTVFVLVNNTDGDDGTGGTDDDIANGALVAIDDAWVNENNTDQNNGNDADLSIRSKLGENRRIYLTFNTASIPSGSTITNATLRLYMSDAPAVDRTYDAYLVEDSWAENSVTWDAQPSVAGLVTDSISTGTSNHNWLEFDVTADVDDFINGSVTNYGWMIKDSAEDGGTPARTSTISSSEKGDELRRPQLVVDFAESSAQPTFYNSPSSNLATTGGDNDGFETNAVGSYSDGGTFATNNNGAGDKHIFGDYGFSIPTGSSINGIEVRADWYIDGDAGTNSLSVELSHDGGTTWTATKTDITETTAEHIVSFGDSSDTWDRAWTAEEFDDGDFLVRVSMDSTNANRDFYLDWIPVRVYYTPAAAPDTTPPDAPTPLTPADGIVLGPVAFTQTWTSVADAVEYRYQSCAVDPGDLGADCTDIKYTNTYAGTSKSVGAGQPDSHFWWRVQARDAADNWSDYGPAFELTIDATAPDAPVLTSPADDTYVSGNPTQTWTASSGTDHYVYESYSDVGLTTLIYTTTLSGTSRTVGGNQTIGFWWRVKAVDSVDNESPWSQVWKLNIDNTDPVDPTPISTSHTVSTWDNDRTIDVTWSGAFDTHSGVDGFYTEWNTSATTITGPLVKEYEETDDSETSPQLASGQDHYFHIATLDNADNWTGTAHLGPFWIDAVNPSVAWVTPLDGATLSGAVPLEATASDADSGMQRVRFRYRPGTSGSFTTIDTDFSDPFEASWDTTSLADGEYQLRAVARDNSTRTRQTTITVTVDNTIPSTIFTSVPADISVTDTLDYEGTSTDALTGVDLVEYRILDSSLAEVLGWTTATPVDGDFDGDLSEDFTFTTPTLSDGEYTVEARATDTAGNIESTATDTVMVDTTDPTDPTDVASTSHTVSVESSTNAITMAWTIAGSTPGATDATSGVDGYSVEFSQSPDTTPDDIKDLEETDTGIASTALADGTWYFHLRTVDNAGHWTSTVHAGPYLIDTTTGTTTTGTVAGASTASPAVCSATPPAGSPSLLSATAGLNSVTLTWSEGAGPLDYYLVAFGIAPGSIAFGNPNIGGAGTTSYTVSGLSGGTTYYFQVRAGNDCAPGSYSNELSATPGGGFIGGLPAGFAEGVLGEATESADLEQTTGLTLPTAEDLSEVLGADVSDWSSWWWLWLLIVVLLVLGWYYLKKKKK